MKYSIIVASYNRINELVELLDSMQDLDFPSDQFEVIISDDGSTDGTRRYAEGSHGRLNVRYLFQENQGPGEARNHGMRQAKGEYFIFLDSDCTVPKHWLKSIDVSVDHEQLDAFGGPDTDHPDFPPLLKAINYAMTSFIGTGGTRGATKSVGKFYPRSFNMGLSRTVYNAIGGMNDLRHGQDMDLSARIYKAGFKVGLIPEAFVFHKRRTSLKKYFRQIFNWGVARVNLGMVHKQLLKPVHFLPTLVVVGVLLTIAIGVFTSLDWIWKFVLAAFLFICLWAFVESWFKHRSVKVSLLSVITLIIQVFAYGLGMLWAWPQALSGLEAKGFVKGYYGRRATDSR